MAIDTKIQDFALASTRLHLSHQQTARMLQQTIEALSAHIEMLPNLPTGVPRELETMRHVAAQHFDEVEERADALIAALEKLVND